MYYLDPRQNKAHVVIVYRNFMAENPKQFSHVGLGVNSLHTAKVLQKKKIRTDVFGVWTTDHIAQRLIENPTATHCLIEAPWVPIEQLQQLLLRFPWVHFIVRAHSQLSFLQVEPGAIDLIRKMMIMQESFLNLTVSANSLELKHFLEKVYTGHCLYLPNLYDLERVAKTNTSSHSGNKLKISSFGAIRLMKNHLGAAGAALRLAKEKNCELEFWISVEREEHGKGVVQSLRNLFTGLPWARLIENPWQSWPEFRRTVGHMDLCMALSYSETFCLTASDAVAEGVPLVGSNAIPWLPDFCCANPDSIDDIVKVSNKLLKCPRYTTKTFNILNKYCDKSVKIWIDYIFSNPHLLQIK